MKYRLTTAAGTDPDMKIYILMCCETASRPGLPDTRAVKYIGRISKYHTIVPGHVRIEP
jgi:hypothetical protein